MTKFPLRTKRKQETRDKLVRIARQLFTTKGYDNTTLDEIAELSGLHVQTLYRHFRTKQDLAKASDEHYYRIFEAEVAEKPKGESTMRFWRNWLANVMKQMMEESESFRTHIRMRHMSSTVLGATLEIRYRYENLLAKHIAEDLGEPAEGIGLPRLIAAMLMGGNDYAWRLFDQTDSDVESDVLKVVDLTIEQFAKYERLPEPENR